jgi:hypothetical protein
VGGEQMNRARSRDPDPPRRTCEEDKQPLAGRARGAGGRACVVRAGHGLVGPGAVWNRDPRPWRAARRPAAVGWQKGSTSACPRA